MDDISLLDQNPPYFRQRKSLFANDFFPFLGNVFWKATSRSRERASNLWKTL